ASGVERYLLSHYGAGQTAWLFAESSSSGKMAVYIYDDGTGNSGHWKYWHSSDSVFDNTWHLIGFSWNAGTMHLYLDGKSIPYTSGGTLAANSIFNSTVNLSIGGTSTSGSFIGSMDEVRLYNEAIPTSQIKELYYSGLNNLFLKGGISKEEYLSMIKGYASIN
ncbi:MAG: LamG domain-containing protein, partial [Candidatus Pacebacteria bacterium]|nr:LamG domain-containing protein [Candidatus Paceibacterota bacterium]